MYPTQLFQFAHLIVPYRRIYFVHFSFVVLVFEEVLCLLGIYEFNFHGSVHHVSIFVNKTSLMQCLGIYCTLVSSLGYNKYLKTASRWFYLQK